jgi:hypothetical protein
MRVAVPPAAGIVYRSPSSSKTIVCPSGERSRESQVPSLTSNATVRVGVSGSESFFLVVSFVLSRVVSAAQRDAAAAGRGAGR